MSNFKAPLRVVWVWIVVSTSGFSSILCSFLHKWMLKLKLKLNSPLFRCNLKSAFQIPTVVGKPNQAAEIIGGLLATKSQSYRVTELQSHRVTEWKTPKGTQYGGGWNFFVPDFNKLTYLLCSQGDNLIFQWCLNRYYSNILIQCYYLVSSFLWILINDFLFQSKMRLLKPS